jgi:hypothetical protein
MITALAIIDGPAVLWALFVLMCVCIGFAILWYVWQKMAKIWEFPELANKIAYTLLFLGLAVVLINTLFSFFGRGFIRW